jgi:hypothetical protein
MILVTIVYSDPAADPETATVLLDGEPALIITRGDDQTHELLVTLATHAKTVAQAVVAKLTPPDPNG